MVRTCCLVSLFINIVFFHITFIQNSVWLGMYIYLVIRIYFLRILSVYLYIASSDLILCFYMKVLLVMNFSLMASRLH